MNTNEVTVGSIATVKVGRNLVEVEILGADGEKWKVKSISSGREFLTAKLESIKITGPIPSNTENTMNEENMNPETETTTPSDTESAPVEEPVAEVASNTDETEETQNPAPESGKPESGKTLSLYEAAVEVLRRSKYPMNAKAIVAKAIERELWKPTGGKTPEQSLYSSIFREIKTKEHPRIVKSNDLRGLFEFNRG